MSVNQVEAVCLLCDYPIPPLGGNEVAVCVKGFDLPGLRQHGYAHPACIQAARAGERGPQVKEVPGGIQNVKGRCEDAPACGCCNP